MSKYSAHTEAMMRGRVYSVRALKNNGAPEFYESAYQFTKQTGWYIQSIRSSTVHPQMQIGDAVMVEGKIHKGDIYQFTFTRTA